VSEHPDGEYTTWELLDTVVELHEQVKRLRGQAVRCASRPERASTPRLEVLKLRLCLREAHEVLIQAMALGDHLNGVLRAEEILAAALCSPAEDEAWWPDANLKARVERLRLQREARCAAGQHEDPDNSGLCILCGADLDPNDDDDLYSPPEGTQQ
jgi:hypothetical protein